MTPECIFYLVLAFMYYIFASTYMTIDFASFILEDNQVKPSDIIKSMLLAFSIGIVFFPVVFALDIHRKLN